MSAILDCTCHGLPTIWCSDASKPAGGSWRCRVKRRESDAASKRRQYRRNVMYWLKDNMKSARNLRERRIRQDELSHS